MRIRGANHKDAKFIEQLYASNKFEIDFKHLERLMIVEDEHGIIAVGSLNTIIEASFLTVDGRSRKSKVLALTALLQQVDVETKTLNYKSYHVFVTNESMLKILKDKFEFVKTSAKQVLLKWI